VKDGSLAEKMTAALQSAIGGILQLRNLKANAGR
jgi:hypothetical protein